MSEVPLYEADRRRVHPPDEMSGKGWGDRSYGSGSLSVLAVVPECEAWEGGGALGPRRGRVLWVAPWGAGWSRSQQPKDHSTQYKEDPGAAVPEGRHMGGRSAPEACHVNTKRRRPDRADARGTRRSERHGAEGGGDEGGACPGQEGDAKGDETHHGSGREHGSASVLDRAGRRPSRFRGFAI